MKGRVLIVDDCEANVRLLETLLQAKYDVATVSSGEECLERLCEFSSGLVLLDIVLPGIDGYETCRQIKSGPLGQFTQVVLLTAKSSKAERLKGYEVGADDYVAKPFDHDELLARLRIHFRLHETMSQLWQANGRVQAFNAELERLVEERTTEVTATRDIAVFALASLAESRDPETGEHLERMRCYCRVLAEELACDSPYADQITEEFISDLFRTSPLHDIGKVGIPDGILLKPSRLTREEFEIMKRHTLIGSRALEQAARQSASGGFLAMAVEIARSHHERFDGQGYPERHSGARIPLSARIVALADVFDALTSARIYKPAFPATVAKTMIEADEGKRFDPVIVEAFRRQYSEFLRFLEARTIRPFGATILCDEARR